MGTEKITYLIAVSDRALTGKIEAFFSGRNLEIQVARDGEEAFLFYRMHRHHMIICDYDLPVLNGLDLLRKVRKLDESARIILIVDPDDPMLLVAAANSGATALIPKPVDMAYFSGMIDQQSEKIQAELDLIPGDSSLLNAKTEVDKSNRILHVISKATSILFQSGFSEDSIPEILKMIGEVTGSSRVYAYKNFIKDEEIHTSRIYEWVAAGIMPAIGNLPVKDIKLSDFPFSRWVDVMKRHRGYISGHLRDFDLAEQQLMKQHGVKSFLLIPIYANELWWGQLGLDDCTNERTWSDTEIAALESLVNNLGAAIHKQNLDKQMIKLNQSLEQRVKERTKELEFEIAERAMAEALLKDSEEKYRLIYENATAGIILIQGETITLVNPAVVEILEEIPRNLIGKKFSEIVAKGNRKEVRRQFSKDRDNQGHDLFYVKVKTPRNNIKWLEIKPTKVTWYGEPAYLVFVSNITERKNAQDELEKLNKNLEQRIESEIRQVELQQQLLAQKSKLESIGELSAGLAHEINQPLVSISMGLDNMLTNVADMGADKTYLTNKINILFEDIGRIKNIIEHVRIFSRDQQNTLQEEFLVSKVMMDALSLVQKQMRESGIRLKITCQASDLRVMGNPYRLEQVILNMLSNARYALTEKLKIPEYAGQQQSVEIVCQDSGGFAQIEITDNGIGIPEEVLPNIFNPFFTTKSEEKGTGLGLSISYGIVMEMNGRISAESKFLEYTRMKVELPLIS